tara:strand:- start:158 stop:490 length:333 start_codon:yes stop_codon:yes gene_type:complete
MEPKNFYQYRATLKRVIDGDTIVLHVDLGFHTIHIIKARLLGINAPERGKEGYSEAKSLIHELLFQAADDDGYLYIETKKTGKYGRWLVTIQDVSEKMAEKYPESKKPKT